MERETLDLAKRLAKATSEEEATRILEEHERQVLILEARYEKSKEEQLHSLKKKLADRRKKKISALQKIHLDQVRISYLAIKCH